MQTILETLTRLWLYDIEVFSQPWLYWWLLIPATAYLGFFFLKWTILTAPLWLPFVILFRACQDAATQETSSREVVARKNRRIEELEDLLSEIAVGDFENYLEASNAARKILKKP